MSRAYRILMVTGEYPPAIGGVGDYTAHLCQALGHSVDEVVVVSSYAGDASDVVAVGRWNAPALAAIARLARPLRADLIHIQYQAGAFQMRPTVNLMPFLLRRFTQLPVITTFHDLRPPYLFPKAGGLRDAAITLMARGSSRVVVTNPEDQARLNERGVMPALIPIGSNLPCVARPSSLDSRTVAYFGMATRSKGILELIDAVALIPKTSRPKIRIVGASIPPTPSNDVVSAGEIERAARFRGVAVERTGFLAPPEAAHELRRAGAIVLPFVGGASLRSGSLLAALASGRSVITTAPDRPEALGSLARMKQLTLTPRGDRRALAEAIHTCLARPVEVDELPQRFTWPSIASCHLDLYRGLIESSHP